MPKTKNDIMLEVRSHVRSGLLWMADTALLRAMKEGQASEHVRQKREVAREREREREREQRRRRLRESRREGESKREGGEGPDSFHCSAWKKNCA